MPPPDELERARDEAGEERRGILMLVVAAFLFSVMSVLVKQAGRTQPVEMLILARGVVTLVLSYAWLRHTGVSPWGRDKPRLVLRGVLGLGGLACFFYAVTALPLAEVTTIHYLNPVFTAALAALLLRERVGWALAAAIALSLAGTLLVARPAFLWEDAAALDASGVAAALGGSIFSAGAYVTVRRLRLTDDPNVIVFYFPLVAVPATLPFALRAWVWPSWVGWLELLAIGVVVQTAQLLLTRGLALVAAARGTTVGYLQIVFAASWGLLLFGEEPSGWTIAGALLIVSATLSLLRRGASAVAAPPSGGAS
jgi:drug/metabolite transporter (DMT)-like permease